MPQDVQGRYLNIRLFAEGIEIPCVSIQVSGGQGQPAQAAIQIVPTDDVHDLKARTYVEAYYYDDRGVPDTAAEDERYRLMFHGEVMAIREVVRAAGVKAFVLVCVDPTSYWDSAVMYYRDATAKVSRNERAAVFAAQHVRVPGSKASAAGDLYQILQGSPACVPGMRGLAAGLIHLLESVGGVQRGRRRFRGINDWFTAAELRLRLSQMLGASPDDDSSARLLKSSHFRKWLNQLLRNQDRRVTFRSVAQVVMQRVFYQYTSIPNPYLSPEREVTTVRYVPVGRAPSRPLPDDLRQLAEDRIRVLEGNLQAMTDDKAAAEEWRKKMSHLVREEMAHQPIHPSGPLVLGDKISDAVLASEVAAEKQSLKQLGQAVVMDQDRELAVVGAREALLTDQGPIERADEATIGKLYQKTLETKKRYEDALLGRHRPSREVKGTAPLNARLPIAVFSPDPWYMAPPKCNVLFPDQYESLSLSRDFRTEATRLQLTIKPEKKSKKTKRTQKVYWSPVTEDVKGVLSTLSASKGHHFIMDHEICSGIQPAEEFFPDMEGLSAADELAKPEEDKGVTITDLSYPQRVANYRMAKSRIASRAGVVTCGLHMDIVPGMPGVILSKLGPEADTNTKGRAPDQYLAVFDRVEHSADQNRGQTTIYCSHLRTQREQAEFLGKRDYQLRVSDGTATKKKVYPGTMRITSEFGERTGDGGYQSRILGEVDVQLEGERLATRIVASLYDMYTAPGEIDPTTKTGFTEPWVISAGGLSADGSSTSQSTSSLEDLSIEVEGGVGTVREYAMAAAPFAEVDGSAKPLDMPVKVVVSQKVRKTKVVGVRTLPFEEVIRPAWAAEIYKNHRIGGFYREMFGIGAITDDSSAFFRYVPRRPEDPNAVQMSAQAMEEQEADRGDEIVAQVKAGCTVAQAVDALAQQYRLARERGAGSWFAQRYTHRPVATMRQIRGRDLRVGRVTSSAGGGSASGATYTFEAGEEGFHSRAYGPYDKLELLDHEATPAIDDPTKLKLTPGIDPRGRRWRVVSAYAVRLSGRSGLLG